MVLIAYSLAYQALPETIRQAFKVFLNSPIIGVLYLKSELRIAKLEFDGVFYEHIVYGRLAISKSTYR